MARPKNMAVLAAALGGLGIIFWIAANWSDFGRAGRFGLLQALVLIMCAGAALLSGVERLVFGAEDKKQGACGSVVDLPSHERLNRRMTVIRGVLSPECSAILRKAPVAART